MIFQQNGMIISFIQLVCIESLLYARHWSRHWKFNSEHTVLSSCPQVAYILWGWEVREVSPDKIQDVLLQLNYRQKIYTF